MERYDTVTLTADSEELSSKNIFKGTSGTLVSYISATDEWIVAFCDPNNHGRYAVDKAKASDLKWEFSATEDEAYDMEKFYSRRDFYNHTELMPPKFKENDRVRLINEKPKYTKKGIKKGMVGIICSDHAVLDEWLVAFLQEDTGIPSMLTGMDADDLEFID